MREAKLFPLGVEASACEFAFVYLKPPRVRTPEHYVFLDAFVSCRLLAYDDAVSVRHIGPALDVGHIAGLQTSDGHRGRAGGSVDALGDAVG